MLMSKSASQKILARATEREDMTGRSVAQNLWHKRGFAAGIAVACSTMFGVWGESVACEEILRAADLDTRAKMKVLDVDDYDLDILRPVFKTLREARQRSKKS